MVTCEPPNLARANVKDPLVERLLGPGKPFELVPTAVSGYSHHVFKGAPRNLGGVYRNARQFRDRLLVVHGDVELTYGEVFARAGALGLALRRDYDVRHGTKVAVVVSNRAEWIISLLAITSIGGVAALVNSRGVAEEMARAIALTQCEVSILDEERDDILSAQDAAPPWRRIVIGTPATPLRAGHDADFASIAAPIDGIDLEPDDMPPEAAAVILFTSGTTGFPKGAVLSHGAIAHTVSLAVFMGTLQDLYYEVETGETLPTRSRAMTTPLVLLGPLFHLSGMVPIFRSISVGTTVHIMNKWNVDIAFDMIERVGMSRLAFVPAMLWDILRSPRATPEVLKQIRYLSNGAAPLVPALVDEIGQRMPHCQLSNTYGQTETTAWTCSISGAVYLDNPESCGWPCPTVEVSIRRDDGSEAERGEPGEIWVSSPGLMSEYFGDTQATSEALQAGWLASGDIGTIDEKGLVRVIDRKKNMVISGGENIYCAEIERVVGECAGVIESIAYGLPDDRLGERLAVTVVIDPETDLTADAVKEHCRAHLAIYKVPREVDLQSARLPRTASNKVDRGTFLSARRG